MVRLRSAVRVRSLVELVRRLARLILLDLHGLVIGCALHGCSVLLATVAGVLGVVLVAHLLLLGADLAYLTVDMHVALALYNRGQVVVFMTGVGYTATLLASS